MPRIIAGLESAKLWPRIATIKLETELFDNFEIGLVEFVSIAKPSRETVLAINELGRARMEFPCLNVSVLFKTLGSKVDDQAEHLAQFAEYATVADLAILGILNAENIAVRHPFPGFNVSEG
jgi:hypothetical protein